MKNYLKLIPATAFAFCALVVSAQTTSSPSNQQSKKPGTTNSGSATTSESQVGSPSRADDQLNQGDPGNPTNKATSTQSGNNKASVSKKSGTTHSRKNKSAAGTYQNSTNSRNGGAVKFNNADQVSPQPQMSTGENNTGSMSGTTEMQATGTNQAGGMAPLGYDKATLDAMNVEMHANMDRMRLMEKKIALLNQKIELLSGSKRTKDLKQQLNDIDDQLETLENQAGSKSNLDQNSNQYNNQPVPEP